LFCQALNQNPSLTKICLERNDLDERAFEMLAELLKQDIRVREVRLRSNRVSDGPLRSATGAE
jgi:Ran GTPase-activating protein (RanGAP) involved in mRNA processing and transport